MVLVEVDNILVLIIEKGSGDCYCNIVQQPIWQRGTKCRNFQFDNINRNSCDLKSDPFFLKKKKIHLVDIAVQI